VAAGYFRKKEKEAINNYKAYVEGIEIKALKDPEEDIIGGFILGDIDFISWVKGTFLSTRNDEKEIPQLKRLKPKISLEKILQVVSDEFGCSKEKILEKGRKTTKPEFSQSILHETLVVQHAVNWAIILVAYRVRPLP